MILPYTVVLLWGVHLGDNHNHLSLVTPRSVATIIIFSPCQVFFQALQFFFLAGASRTCQSQYYPRLHWLLYQRTLRAQVQEQEMPRLFSMSGPPFWCTCVGPLGKVRLLPYVVVTIGLDRII